MEESLAKALRRIYTEKQEIKDKYQGKKTTLISDMKGSSPLFEQLGDIEAAAIIQKHQDIFIEIINSHQGKGEPIGGDSILAFFDSSADALKSTVKIQQELLLQKDKISIRIGLHTGDVFLDPNMQSQSIIIASRIMSLADGGQILISSTTYQEAKDIDSAQFYSHGKYTLKGILKPIEVYEVLWNKEQKPKKPTISSAFGEVTGIGFGKSIKMLLPEGSLRILLAMGIPQPNTNINLCSEYIHHLASLISKTDYSLIYSGTDGGNFATKLCKELIKISPTHKKSIYSFIAEEYENPKLFRTLQISKKELLWFAPIGNEIRYAGMTREIRDQKLVKECDFCIVMAGERVVLHLFELCKLIKKPILSLYFSGGIAQEIFSRSDQLESCKEIIVESCGDKGWHLFTEINNTHTSAEEKAKWTIELIDILRKMK